MRVFCTGVFKSATKACAVAFGYPYGKREPFVHPSKYVKHYTIGHESYRSRASCLEYPDNHIEVSHKLGIIVPILKKKYSNVKFVWLTRDRNGTIDSIVRMCSLPETTFKIKNIANDNEYDINYGDFFTWYWDRPRKRNKKETAEFIYDVLYELYSVILQDAYKINVANAYDEWPKLWEWLGLEGDVYAAREHWKRKY